MRRIPTGWRLRFDGRTTDGWRGYKMVYFCRNYSKVLGVSHRKGFWMG